MGFNSNLIGASSRSLFLDALRESFSSPTIEGYYSDKLCGKSNLSYASIAGHAGDDTLRIELYFINYVESASTAADPSHFWSAVQESFHRIATNNSASLGFESCDLPTIAHHEPLFNSDYISSRIKYTRCFGSQSQEGGAARPSSWNGRLANLYPILRHLGTGRVERHCDECARLAGVLEGSAACRLVLLFSLLGKTRALENTFMYLFDRVAGLYWNYELLSLSFSNVAKGLVSNALQDCQRVGDRARATSDILHSFLLSGNVYSDPRWPNAESFMAMLGSFAMNTALHHSDLCVLSEDKQNTFTNLYVALILTHVVRASEASGEAHGPYSPRLGLKNQANSEFAHLRTFVEAFMRALSERLSRGGEPCSRLSNIDAFLDRETYAFLTSLRFAPGAAGTELLHCRAGAVLLYMLALHNQITSVRLNEVAHMRLLYSLPWAPAAQFCATDAQLSFILPGFKRAVIECFGSEIFISSCQGFTLEAHLDELASAHVGRHCDRGDAYYPRLFPFSALLSNAYMILDRRASKTQRSPFDTDFIYRTVSRSLLKLVCPVTGGRNRSLFPHVSNGNEAPASAKPPHNTRSFGQLVQWKWFAHYLSLACQLNSTACYLSVLDALITHFISQEPSWAEKLRLDDLYLSTHASNPALDPQRNLSSNFLALNQNPLNLVLSLPVSVLSQLLHFRLFGNLLALLLSKLNKYIYEGIPSLLSSTASQADFFQLTALQCASIINVATDLSARLPRAAARQVRSLVAVLLSLSPGAYEVICFSGIRPTPSARFTHEVFGPDVTLKPLVDNYAYYLRRCQDDPEEWYSSVNTPFREKSDIRVARSTGKPPKSLDPLDKWDVALFHLYNLHLLALETEIPRENYEASPVFAHIENALSAFWDFMQNNSEPAPPEFVKGSVALIAKLHYLHPCLTRKSIAITSNLVGADIRRDSREALEEINLCLKAIEYNFMVSNKDEKGP